MVSAPTQMADTALLMSFLERLQSSFLSMKLEELLEAFELPLPVYSSAGLKLVREAQEFVAMARMFREIRGDTVSSAFELLSLEPIVNDRFRAVAQWHHYDTEGRSTGNSQVRYFIHLREPDQFAIEMIEFLVMPITLDQANTIIH